MAISYLMFAFRFTLILSSKHAQQKQQPNTIQVRRRSERSSTGSSDSVSSSTNSQLFPKHGSICKKDRIQHNKKDEYPHLIKTKTGEVSFKLAAKEKLPSFYYENKDEDLIAQFVFSFFRSASLLIFSHIHVVSALSNYCYSTSKKRKKCEN